MDRQITQKSLQAYGAHLRLEGRPVSREAVAEWKNHLLELRYAPTTVNAALAALNSL